MFSKLLNKLTKKDQQQIAQRQKILEKALALMEAGDPYEASYFLNKESLKDPSLNYDPLIQLQRGRSGILSYHANPEENGWLFSGAGVGFSAAYTEMNIRTDAFLEEHPEAESNPLELAAYRQMYAIRQYALKYTIYVAEFRDDVEWALGESKKDWEQAGFENFKDYSGVATETLRMAPPAELWEEYTIDGKTYQGDPLWKKRTK